MQRFDSFFLSGSTLFCQLRSPTRQPATRVSSVVIVKQMQFSKNCLRVKQTCALDVVHTTPEKFENGGFTLKTHLMFSVHTTPEEFKIATVTDYSNLCLRRPKADDHRDALVFEKLSFQNVFGSRKNEKLSLSISPKLKSVFEKFRFRHGLVWKVGLTIEIK